MRMRLRFICFLSLKKAKLGIGDELVWNRSSTGLLADGTLHSVSSNREFLTLRLIDKIRLGLTMVYASRVNSWHRLEKTSAARWLSRWTGRNAYLGCWRPLLRSKLGDNADRASAAFIWAIMKHLYRARTSGAKVEKLGYVRTGYNVRPHSRCPPGHRANRLAGRIIR